VGNDGAGMSDALLREGRPYSENDDMKKAIASGEMVGTDHERRC